MASRLCLLIITLALLLPLHAQDEPVHMRPDFALSFPLTQSGTNVTVPYPILINPSTVLKPGMVMRTLYVLSYDLQSSSAATALVLAQKGDAQQAYSRAPAGSSNEPRLPPELAHELNGYRRTVWQVPNNFVLAMAQYPTDAMHLIYTKTDKDQDLLDERFSFFDGLFIGLPGGKVTVLGVEKESKAEMAGIKAGDEIVSVGGQPTQDSLGTFAAAYASAKKTAMDNEVASYSMTVRSGGATRTVSLGLPPSLKGGLMDGFDSQPSPPPQKPVAPATTP